MPVLYRLKSWVREVIKSIRREQIAKGFLSFPYFGNLTGDSQAGRYLAPWWFWSGMEKGFTGKGDMQKDT